MTTLNPGKGKWRPAGHGAQRSSKEKDALAGRNEKKTGENQRSPAKKAKKAQGAEDKKTSRWRREVQKHRGFQCIDRPERVEEREVREGPSVWARANVP